ncbi:MAG: hypothetical protein K8R23_04485 [Chthoniobacter sp.]|nr:hypothetical protein [Chthoniobacter sp.]
MLRVTRPELLLFLLTFCGFAYFNQGGGWNQNSRFAEVRAIVEQGRFAIDDFFVYQRDPARDELVRVPTDHAEYDFEGQRHALCWVDGEWKFYPISGRPTAEGTVEEAMHMRSASGDVAYVPQTGHFHPNKPPGTSLLAVPAYFAIFHFERACGINPDHWWTLNVNAWLTTILSVGLISALGSVIFFRLACDFAGDEKMPALLATLALAFGTTFFPFGTILFDHNLTAVLLLASFYWLREKTAHPVLAGFCAGFAVVTNYVAGGAVVALGLYALLARCRVTEFPWWKRVVSMTGFLVLGVGVTCRFAGGDHLVAGLTLALGLYAVSVLRPSTLPGWADWRRAIFFGCGGLGPAVVLGWYHYVNFGSPFALANDFQNPLFKDPHGSLGMFALPRDYVAALITVSPYRGVFWLAPVLLLGVAGWIVWLRGNSFSAEARLGFAIFGWFFLVNASFNGYHGGFSAGPRYLVPGLPFLALPVVVGFVRWKKTALILLALSVAQQFLLTATDAQNCLAVGGHARVDDAHRKDDFFCNIVTEYAAPLFFTGRIGPLTEQLLSLHLEAEEQRLTQAVLDETLRAAQIATMRREARAAVERGAASPIMLAAIRGPVSVNIVNVFDGLLGYGAWPWGSEPVEWASFNTGELLWPQSRWSLLPLLLVSGGLGFALVRACRRADRNGLQLRMTNDEPTSNP